MIRFRCPACAAPFAVGDEKAGLKTRCPKCRSGIAVPTDTPAELGSPSASLMAAPVAPPAVRTVIVPVSVPHYPRAGMQGPERVEHVHRARGAFRTAFAGTMGCMTAVVAFAVLAVGGFVALALFGFSVTRKDRAADPPAVGPAEPAPAAGVPARAPEAEPADLAALFNAVSRLVGSVHATVRLTGRGVADAIRGGSPGLAVAVASAGVATVRLTILTEMAAAGAKVPVRKVRTFDDWPADVGASGVTRDGLTVALVKATVAKVPLLDGRGETTRSEENHLMILLRVSTADRTKKHDHETWSREDGFSARVRATDEFGNRYRLCTFGATTDVLGVKRSVVVTAGSPAADLVPLEIPTPDAGYVIVELDDPRGREGGRFRFVVPRWFWSKGWE